MVVQSNQTPRLISRIPAKEFATERLIEMLRFIVINFMMFRKPKEDLLFKKNKFTP
jgi:hypothetical protein